MQKVKIITDSSCTMDKHERDALSILVVPLSVMVDGVVYTDDDQFSGEQFMEKMAHAKSLPKSSQPPIGEFAEIYDELGKDGSEILSIHMTKALSGTAEAARQASHLSSSKVTVLETDTIDQGLSFQVIRAAQMAKAGANVSEILAELSNIQENSKLYIGVSTLNNLVKGGRISRATGMLSNILNIKVVMELKDTMLVPVTKGRGKKTFDKWFTGLKEELSTLTDIKKIGISHADAKELAEHFKIQLEELLPNIPVQVLHTGPVISTHTGPGAFAIMYYTN